MQLTPWLKIRFLYTPSILLVLVIGSCTSPGKGVLPAPTATVDPILLDWNILTDSPCPAPCWNGLELGHSTKAEILATVQHVPLIDPKEFPEVPDYYWDQSTGGMVTGTLIQLQCRPPVDGTCAALMLVNDNLKQIYLAPIYPLTFAQVVDHFGAPEYVRLSPHSPEGGLQCDIALIWKQRGIIIRFRNGVPAQDQVQCSAVRGGKGIRSDLPVEDIVYALPSDLGLVNTPEPGGDFVWSGFAQP